MPLPERPTSKLFAWTKFRFPIEYSIAGGHVVAMFFALLIGIISSFALQSTIRSRERVEQIYAHEVLEVERLLSLVLERSAQGRAYLLTGKPERLEESNAARRAFDIRLKNLMEQADSPKERAQLENIGHAADAHQAALSRAFALYRAGGSHEDVAAFFEAEVAPKLIAVEFAISEATLGIDSRLAIARDDAQGAASRAIRLVIVTVVFTVLLIAGLSLLFLRTMQRIRRSSEEHLTLLAREQHVRAIAEETRRQLTESVTRLERINADLDAFTGRIAHDLRNLLTPITLAPARLRRAHDPEARERIHSSLERSISRANATLEGLLAFSRSGRGEETVHSASVSDAIRDVVEDFAPIATASQTIVDIDTEDFLVACSPALLRVIMHNILGNALKFIVHSTERRVWIRAHRAAGGVEIECTDTGPGIPSESVPHIFEPFYRVPGAAAAGSGIGLATVNRIVTAHSGRIDCVSEIGKGTSIRVWLPEAG